MLHAPLPPTIAKLDISRLLESSPSPPSRLAASQAQPENHGARSASDPPPARALAAASKRSSISSVRSTTDSFTALSASSLPSQGPFNQLGATYSQIQHQQQQHRPRIPSLSALPLPIPQPPLSDFEVQDQPELRSQLHSRSSSQYVSTDQSYSQASKRPAQHEHASAPPAKRQSKWTAEEDALVIELRGAGMKWEDISKRIPGRTPLSCRLHYQNYIERRSQWDEDRKNRLARLYERLKPEMWKPLAAELNVPWRAAEAMHWQLGQVEMARRAGVTPFSISSASTGSHLASRADNVAVESVSTGVYTGGGSYAATGYNVSAYQQPARSEHFDERSRAYRGATQGRTRSVSNGSSHDRVPVVTSFTGTSWTQTTPITASGRPASDTWPLPRLPEVELAHPASEPPESNQPLSSTRGFPP